LLIRGAAIAVDLSTFILALITFLYIYVSKLYVSTWNGWSKDSLYDWDVYLRLAIPGLLTILIEWSNFEIGILASAKIGKNELALVAIGMQVLLIAFQVTQTKFKFKTAVYQKKLIYDMLQGPICNINRFKYLHWPIAGQQFARGG
jgi:hypothetical protein